MQQHRTWKLLCSLWSTVLHSVAFFIGWNVLDFCDNQTCMYIIEKSRKDSLQVNLCQKVLFLHQLTHNMMTDCSLFMKIVSSEYLQNMLCTQIVVFVLTLRTILVHNMFSDVASFWKRFTCISIYCNELQSSIAQKLMKQVYSSFD